MVTDLSFGESFHGLEGEDEPSQIAGFLLYVFGQTFHVDMEVIERRMIN